MDQIRDRNLKFGLKFGQDLSW